MRSCVVELETVRGLSIYRIWFMTQLRKSVVHGMKPSFSTLASVCTANG